MRPPPPPPPRPLPAPPLAERIPAPEINPAVSQILPPEPPPLPSPKPLLPSACAWAKGSHEREIYYSRMLAQAVRAADPFVAIKDGWLLRRLSPFCSRIELSQLPRTRDEKRLFRAMGWELANIHLGTRQATRTIHRDLSHRKSKWLRDAAELMAEATAKDWKEWKKSKPQA